MIAVALPCLLLIGKFELKDPELLQIIFNSGFESRFLKDRRVYTVSIL